jgi:serine/threonine protein kinase
MEEGRGANRSLLYEKGKELGRGAFGAVYAARRKSDNAALAIKRVHEGLGSGGVDFTALREIRVLNMCQHENILSLLDVFATKGKIFLVMELMETDLFKILQDRRFPLSPSYIKNYALQFLKGLAYLHSKWISHRDLVLEKRSLFSFCFSFSFFCLETQQSAGQSFRSTQDCRSGNESRVGLSG